MRGGWPKSGLIRKDLRFSSFWFDFRSFFFFIQFLYIQDARQPFSSRWVHDWKLRNKNVHHRHLWLGLAQFSFCSFFSCCAHTKTHFIIFICLSLFPSTSLFFLAHTFDGITRGNHYAPKTNQRPNERTNKRENEMKRNENNHKYAKYFFWFKHQRTRPLLQAWI